jgi:hypothetical protein
MKPSIYDIIRKSLHIAKNIIFFLPRTLLLIELFDIIKTAYAEMGIKTDRIYLDVQIFRSASFNVDSWT